MGVSVRFLDPASDACAAVAATQSVGHFRDAEAIASFAAGVDVLTVEIEHIDADAMEAAGTASGAAVEPTPATLRTIQVRVRTHSSVRTHSKPGWCMHACEQPASKQSWLLAGVPPLPCTPCC